MQSKASSFRARTFFITGAVFLGIVLLAFVMSLICSPYDPNATSAREILLPPSGAHLFGTDNFGRDVFSRILDASKYTIFISIAGVAIALFLGKETFVELLRNSSGAAFTFGNHIFNLWIIWIIILRGGDASNSLVLE